MAQRKLLILLGKGQTELKDDISTYRKVKYFFPNEPEKVIETPFVGEAIIRLSTEQFDQVHILGTQQAMWDILFLHCASNLRGKDKKQAKKNVKALEKKIKENSLGHEDVQKVAALFSEYVGVPHTFAHIIELGITQEDFWNIFETLSEKIELKGHQISFDITHSVRSHPIFFFFFLFFLNSVVKDVHIDSFYYGALAFQDRKEYGGKTPILDIQAYIELMKWIDAAQAFTRYADTDPIAHLLTAPHMNELKTTLREFSYAVQLNSTDSIKKTANDLVEKLNALDAEAPRPLRILKEYFASLPRLVSDEQYDWQSMLNLAVYHAEHSRLGLAVVCLSEAITYRFGEIFQIQGRIFQKIAWQVTSWMDRFNPTNKRKEFMHHVAFGSRFLNYYDQLKDVRDAIAHEAPMDLKSANRINEIIGYFAEHLGSSDIEVIKEYYKPIL